MGSILRWLRGCDHPWPVAALGTDASAGSVGTGEGGRPVGCKCQGDGCSLGSWLGSPKSRDGDRIIYLGGGNTLRITKEADEVSKCTCGGRGYSRHTEWCAWIQAMLKGTAAQKQSARRYTQNYNLYCLTHSALPPESTFDEWYEGGDNMHTRWFAFTVGATSGHLKEFSSEADLHQYLDKAVLVPKNWVIIKSKPPLHPSKEGHYAVETYLLDGPVPQPKYQLVPHQLVPQD